MVKPSTAINWRYMENPTLRVASTDQLSRETVAVLGEQRSHFMLFGRFVQEHFMSILEHPGPCGRDFHRSMVLRALNFHLAKPTECSLLILLSAAQSHHTRRDSQESAKKSTFRSCLSRVFWHLIAKTAKKPPTTSGGATTTMPLGP